MAHLLLSLKGSYSVMQNLLLSFKGSSVMCEKFQMPFGEYLPNISKIQAHQKKWHYVSEISNDFDAIGKL